MWRHYLCRRSLNCAAKFRMDAVDSSSFYQIFEKNWTHFEAKFHVMNVMMQFCANSIQYLFTFEKKK